MKKSFFVQLFASIALGYSAPIQAYSSFEKDVQEIVKNHAVLKKLADHRIKKIELDLLKSQKPIDKLLEIDPYLIKITISSNTLISSFYEKNLSYRAEKIINSIKWLLEKFTIQDCEFYISLGDSTPLENEVVFAMCKEEYKNNVVLIPDYDQLAANYEVLKNNKLTQKIVPFESKKNKAFWRGCTAGSLFTPENYLKNHRVKLCQLSQLYPQIIDAGFTFYAQGAEDIPEIQNLRKDWASYEDEINHRYLIWVDGNVSSYSASGWRLFSNSCVLKQNSPFIQWYFCMLVPYFHYVPFEHDCSDLIDQITWCINHPHESENIAKNSRDFAKNHITQAHAYAYLYMIIDTYSKLFKRLK